MDKNMYGLVEKLLEQWKVVLKLNAKNSMVKASQSKNGLKNRIKFDGKIVIFDYPTTKAQHQIQKELLKLMPEFQALILSEPAILEYDWITEDYLELYSNHYNLVVTKLLEAIGKLKFQLNNV